MKIRLMVAFLEGDDVLAVLSAKQTKELIGYGKQKTHGDRIMAIRMIRTWTGLSLKESKDIIDVLHDESARRAAYHDADEDVKVVCAPLIGV